MAERSFSTKSAIFRCTLQAKLLRVLQEREYEKVGSSRPVQVNVRIMAASHRPLEALIKAGQLREDLYYRLNVVTILIPPLRERRSDLALLIDHFLRHLRGEKRQDDPRAYA